MKKIHKYIFLAISIVLASSTAVSQQNSHADQIVTNCESLEIVYTDSNTGYAVDMNGNYIYKTTDKGLNWVNVTVPGKDQIKKILFSTPKHKSGTKAGFEGESKLETKVSYTGSKGFMPADDFANVQTSGTASIKFTLLNPGFVSIKIYDNSGNAIDEITKSSFGTGNHTVKWNSSKFSGKVYYCSLVTSEFAETRKLEINNN